MKKRVEFFDSCKGILIILVVLGHVMPEDALFHRWLYTWHMPCFFMLSGSILAYRKYGEKSFWGSRGVLISGIKGLILPYFFYAGILLLARWADSGFQMEVLRWQVIDYMLLCGIGAMWFLPCLFLAQMIYYGIQRTAAVLRNVSGLPKYGVPLMVMIAASVLAAVPLTVSAPHSVIMVLFRAMIACFFLICGDYPLVFLRKLKSVSNGYHCLLLVGLLLASGLGFAWTGAPDVGLSVLKFGNTGGGYLWGALTGSGFLFLLIAEVERLGIEWGKGILQYYGKNSLIVMGTHQAIMMGLRIPIQESFMWNVVLCSLILAAEIPVIWLVHKIKNAGKGRS